MSDILQLARAERSRLLAQTAKIDAFMRYAEYLLTHHADPRLGRAASSDGPNAIGDEAENSNVVRLESSLAQTLRGIADERKVTS